MVKLSLKLTNSNHITAMIDSSFGLPPFLSFQLTDLKAAKSAK